MLQKHKQLILRWKVIFLITNSYYFIDAAPNDRQRYIFSCNFIDILDLPPLRDSSTISLQFYQQREEGTLLSPELVTPSPTARIPANITTSTTGTSPIRTFNESASHPFRRLNSDEESGATTRRTNEGQVNSIEHDTRINHASFDLPSMDISQADSDRNPNIGRPGGSDESL